MFSRNGTPPKHKVAKVSGPATRTTAGSYIGPDVIIRGDLSCAADVKFDGTITGNLDCANLAVGPSGRIDGAVVVNSFELNGTLNGSVQADTVRLGPHAELTGDITYDTLGVDQGASFEGKLMRKRPTEDGKVTVLRRPR